MLAGQPSDCYANTDDCEGADASTWQTIWKVTYPDNPSTSVTLCVCTTASFTANDLAHYVGKVLRLPCDCDCVTSDACTAYSVQRLMPHAAQFGCRSGNLWQFVAIWLQTRQFVAGWLQNCTLWHFV